MERQQYVCLVCGFNMVGFYPQHCPFCGSSRDNFITAQECSQRFKVHSTPVKRRVNRLNSVPPLGIEHAAYRIETDYGAYWIDSPSSFDRSLQPVDSILFTHHHFLGACNLYREEFRAEVRIHYEDSRHQICRPFTFDETFSASFEEAGISACHIGGHTPGFTCYVFEDVLFICDYVFWEDSTMRYNPFGPADETVAGGERLGQFLEGRQLKVVCGYNYVTDYAEWKRRFEAGPLYGGY